MKARLRCFRIWVTGGEKVGPVSVDTVLMCIVGVESREELPHRVEGGLWEADGKGVGAWLGPEKEAG